jgi:hypothetical protein
MIRGVALAVASAGLIHHMLSLADTGSSEMPATHMSRAAPSGYLSQIPPSSDAPPHITSTMSKPTGIQEKPTAPKSRTLFGSQTRPADHVSSSPRTESMSDADLQSSPALGVAPDLQDIPGLVATPEEPDSQDTTSGEYGSDTEEEDNTELENYYLNKPKEYERRVETLFGDTLRVRKSKDGNWYTFFEGEVIDGQSYLPARYRQPSYKETLSAGQHSFSEVHTAVEPASAVEPSNAVEHTVYKQPTAGSQSDMFKQSVLFGQSSMFDQSNAFERPTIFDQSNNTFEQTNVVEHTVYKQPTTGSQSGMFERPTTVNRSNHRNNFRQPTTAKRSKATKVTKPNKAPSRTPSPALADALAHHTRDVSHLSTLFHHGSANINPRGALPSLAPLALQEQPVTAHQQRRGIATPSDQVMGGTDPSQHADDLDTDEYPPTAPPSPHSAVAHLAHGGSPASGLLSPPPSQTVEVAMFDAASDAAGSPAGSCSGSPAQADRVAWLRDHQG